MASAFAISSVFVSVPLAVVPVFDFDDPSCLKDETYYNITDLKKGTHTDSNFPFRTS